MEQTKGKCQQYTEALSWKSGEKEKLISTLCADTKVGSKAALWFYTDTPAARSAHSLQIGTTFLKKAIKAATSTSVEAAS